MAKEKTQQDLAREALGTVIKERDDGKYILAYKYDGKVIGEYATADAAFKAQKKK